MERCFPEQVSAAKRKEDQKAKEQTKKEDQKIKRARVDAKKDTVSLEPKQCQTAARIPAFMLLFERRQGVPPDLDTKCQVRHERGHARMHRPRLSVHTPDTRWRHTHLLGAKFTCLCCLPATELYFD